MLQFESLAETTNFSFLFSERLAQLMYVLNNNTKHCCTFNIFMR